MKFKSGPLTEDEKLFIKQNAKQLTVDDLCRALQRRPALIKRFVQNEGIYTKDTDAYDSILSLLRSKYYYREVREQFTEDELDFFEHEWVNFYRQFNEDVTHTEELQILEVIRTEILINRSMKDRLKVMDSIANVEQLLDQEMSRPPEDRDGSVISSLNAQLGSLLGSKTSYIQEHEKLLTKKERYLKDLKGTREQRKKQADDARTNFNVWLRQLEQITVREREGYDMEVQAIAAEKARQQLSNYHTFQDGMIDRPLLNADSITDEDTI